MTNSDLAIARRLRTAAEKAERIAAHKEHLKQQKNEADYNNQVKGHHTNRDRNIVRKLLDQGTDFAPRFPITLKFSHKDFNALKKCIEG